MKIEKETKVVILQNGNAVMATQYVNGNSASHGENQSPNQEKILIFLLMGFDFMLIFSTAFMEGGGA